VIRPRGGTTRRGGDGRDQPADETSSSVGARLRQARDQRGLDLLGVHDRLGRPITQIESLEHDDHAALPDEALAVSTLRRYATLLGLDGDALHLQWSAERKGVTVDLSATRAVPAMASVVAAVTTGPDHLRAFTETGEVPQVGGRGTYDYKVDTGPPTGTFPVVPRAELRESRRSVARARRRMKAPTWLKVLTWVSALLVLVVAAGWVLLSVKPTVLASGHILRVVPAGATSGTPGGSTPRTLPPAGHQAFPVVPAGTSPSGASYKVASSKFSLVVATSGRCWVQVTSSSSPVPLVSGVQDGGKVLTFPATGTMTVEVGSSAVLVGITIKGKNAFTDIPTVVPFAYTFASA
jgi:transcriptional regulator with XRE-family HTH domain